MKTVSKKAKRRMTLSFLLLIAVISTLFTGVFNDWKQILNNKKDIKMLSTKYTDLLDQEKSLDAEVVKFQDPNYIARYARERYLYSLPDELIVKLPKK